MNSCLNNFKKIELEVKGLATASSSISQQQSGVACPE